MEDEVNMKLAWFADERTNERMTTTMMIATLPKKKKKKKSNLPLV